MNILRVFIIGFLFLSLPPLPRSCAQAITDEAQSLYQNHQQDVYQIQTIDLATGKKSSIGSGFRFSPDGHMATNYHVVSQIIQSPQRYRLEYLKHDGSTGGGLSILDVDVIHDVAIVKSDQTTETYLPLGNSSLSKGSRIFSMGNPYDLGMTIIEGLYNGLMEKSLYRKILFSGSINSGMSGGPGLNHNGEVIGINVSTAGNQVSFLVPVEYLKELYQSILNRKNAPIKDWDKHIENQLLANQDDYIEKFLAPDWDVLPIGDVLVPGEILNTFKCWGDSKDQKKKLYNYAYVECATEDTLFLSSKFSTGKIIYKYNWMQSKGLNPIRFYHLYENHFKYPHIFENVQEKTDATNFQCTTDFIQIDHKKWKIAYCARQYKKYQSLYDINISLASISEKDRGLLAEVVALGISKKNTQRFARKFIRSIQWKE